MPPRKADKPQMNEKDKIVALTHLEDGWKIAEVALDTVSSVQCPALQEEVKRLWCMGTPVELLKKLSDSMPSVIDAGGEMTKY